MGFFDKLADKAKDALNKGKEALEKTGIFESEEARKEREREAAEAKAAEEKEKAEREAAEAKERAEREAAEAKEKEEIARKEEILDSLEPEELEKLVDYYDKNLKKLNDEIEKLLFDRIEDNEEEDEELEDEELEDDELEDDEEEDDEEEDDEVKDDKRENDEVQKWHNKNDKIRDELYKKKEKTNKLICSKIGHVSSQEERIITSPSYYAGKCVELNCFCERCGCFMPETEPQIEMRLPQGGDISEEQVPIAIDFCGNQLVVGTVSIDAHITPVKTLSNNFKYGLAKGTILYLVTVFDVKLTFNEEAPSNPLDSLSIDVFIRVKDDDASTELSYIEWPSDMDCGDGEITDDWEEKLKDQLDSSIGFPSCMKVNLGKWFTDDFAEFGSIDEGVLSMGEMQEVLIRPDSTKGNSFEIVVKTRAK